MAGYQSRLRTVIEERKIRQEIVQRELAIQQQLLSREEAQLQMMVDASEAALNGLSEQQKGLGTPGEIEIYYQFVKYQAKKIKRQEGTLHMIANNYEAKRKELEKVTQDKKMVEKIEEHRKATFAATLKKRESAFLDEVGSRMKRELQ